MEWNGWGMAGKAWGGLRECRGEGNEGKDGQKAKGRGKSDRGGNWVVSLGYM